MKKVSLHMTKICAVIFIFLVTSCVNQSTSKQRIDAYTESYSALLSQKSELQKRQNHPGIAMAERTIQKDDASLKITDTWELCNAYYYVTWEVIDAQERAKIEKILKDRKALTSSEWSAMNKSLRDMIGKSNDALICRYGMPSQVNTISAARQSEQHTYMLGVGPESIYIYITRGRVVDINGFGY